MQVAVLNDDVDAIRSSLVQTPASEMQETLTSNLTLAMSHRSLNAVRLLFSLGGKLKVSPFIDAITREDTGVFQALCDAGWDINSTQHEYTALHFAVHHTPVLRWLLDHGANPNTVSVRHPGSCALCETPLASAAKLSTAEPLKILLARGARDPKAIFHAIGIRRQLNGTATIQALIDHGVDINHIDRRRGTPLCQAIHVGDEEKLKLLLDHGADPYAKRPGASSACESAKWKGRMDFVTIIEAASGQMGP